MARVFSSRLVQIREPAVCWLLCGTLVELDGLRSVPNSPVYTPNGLQNGLQAGVYGIGTKKAFRNYLLQKAL